MTSRAGVCCAAALALFCAGCIQRAPRPTAEPYLKSLRSSQNPDDLYKAAIALGNMREAKAAPLLAVHLSNKSPRVRAQVAMALGQIGDPASAPYLRKALIEEQEAAPRKWMIWACANTGGVAEKEALMGLKIKEKAKAVFGGAAAVDQRLLKELDAAMEKINSRLKGKDKI